MTDFDLDLRDAEAELGDLPSDQVVLGVLDGETPADEWVQAVRQGNILVLSVEGDPTAMRDAGQPWHKKARQHCR